MNPLLRTKWYFRVLFPFAVLCLLLVLSVFSFMIYLHHASIPPEGDLHPVTGAFVPLLRDGDLIFRMGYGFWSERFAKAASRDSRFSHCGILRNTSNGWVVIHAEAGDATGQGTVYAQPLDQFLQNSRSIGIFRLKLSEESILRIADFAESRCGTPFDYHFDAKDSSRLYCTELLAFSLKKVSPQIRIPTMRYADMEIIPLDFFCSQEIAELIYAWPSTGTE